MKTAAETIVVIILCLLILAVAISSAFAISGLTIQFVGGWLAILVMLAFSVAGGILEAKVRKYFIFALSSFLFSFVLLLCIFFQTMNLLEPVK